ncbi:MAG: hypothetical protein RIT50_289 [Bacteroidota bacterium]|jgi:hypothetical protein
MLPSTFKDYYQILGIKPGAHPTEIKKAWRVLVRKWHPDVSGSEQINTKKFQDIQEAYETLIDPLKKEKYLQQRWLQQVTQTKHLSAPTNSNEVLHAIIKVEQLVYKTGSYRLDTDFIEQYILFLLSPRSIKLVNEPEDAVVSEEITKLILRCCIKLPSKSRIAVLNALSGLNQPDSIKLIAVYKKENTLRWTLERYKTAIMLLIVALLCWLISSLA